MLEEDYVRIIESLGDYFNSGGSHGREAGDTCGLQGWMGLGLRGL